MLKRLADGPWTTRIAEPTRRTVLRWCGDDDARRAVYATCARLLSGVARVALMLRAVLCERSFGQLLDRDGMRRTWLRERDNVARRYLIHVAGHNLGLLMRSCSALGPPGRRPTFACWGVAAGSHLPLVLLALQGIGTDTRPTAIALITVMPTTMLINGPPDVDRRPRTEHERFGRTAGGTGHYRFRRLMGGRGAALIAGPRTGLQLEPG